MNKIFLKFLDFWFVFLPKELKSDALKITIKRKAKNDYYEASDIVLQIGHLVGCNRVQQQLHRNSSKM